MPTAVYLEFVPLDDTPDLTKLHIYEASAPDGPFNLIETVTPVGTQGDYIDHHTTVNALSAADWFAVKWENAAGAQTDMSEPMQGGTRTVVADVVSRMLLRDPLLENEIAFQEAEAVVEQVTGTVDPDPASVTKNMLSGMTLLAMARAQLYNFVSGSASSADSWTAGLVSMKSSSATSSSANMKNITDMILAASRMLGLSVSRVAQIVTPEIAGGLAEIKTADISRLLIEVE